MTDFDIYYLVERAKQEERNYDLLVSYRVDWMFDESMRLSEDLRRRNLSSFDEIRDSLRSAIDSDFGRDKTQTVIFSEDVKPRFSEDQIGILEKMIRIQNRSLE